MLWQYMSLFFYQIGYKRKSFIRKKIIQTLDYMTLILGLWHIIWEQWSSPGWSQISLSLAIIGWVILISSKFIYLSIYNLHLYLSMFLLWWSQTSLSLAIKDLDTYLSIHSNLYWLPILAGISKTTLDKSLGLTQYKQDFENKVCTKRSYIDKIIIPEQIVENPNFKLISVFVPHQIYCM